MTALLGAGLLLATAACGDDSDDGGSSAGDAVVADGNDRSGGDDAEVTVEAPEGFAPTPGFLRDTADRSAAEPFQFEMWLAFSDEPPTGDPMASGRVDGERFAVEVDLISMFSLMGETMSNAFGDEGFEDGIIDEGADDGFEGGMPPPDQLEQMLPPEAQAMTTMDIVGDSTSVYYRNALFLMFLPLGEDEAEAEADMSSASTGWSFMDLARLEAEGIDDFSGDEPTFQPDELLEVVRDGDNVTDLGGSEVRGDPVAGLSVDVTADDLMAATAANAYDENAAGAPITLELWVDRDGYLRQISYGFSYLDLADEADLDGPVPDLTVSYTMEMFGYGEPVDIDFPADYVDITDRLANMMSMAAELEDLAAEMDLPGMDLPDPE